MKLNVATLAILGLLAALFAAYAWKQPWTATHIAGLCIALPALVLLVMARIQLGSAFSIEAKASTLVTTGLYARIRNPIYVFSAFVVAGAFIWSRQWWMFLFFIAIIPLQIFRTRKESQMLEEKFGDAYREYKKKTWF